MFSRFYRCSRSSGFSVSLRKNHEMVDWKAGSKILISLLEKQPEQALQDLKTISSEGKYVDFRVLLHLMLCFNQLDKHNEILNLGRICGYPQPLPSHFWQQYMWSMSRIDPERTLQFFNENKSSLRLTTSLYNVILVLHVRSDREEDFLAVWKEMQDLGLSYNTYSYLLYMRLYRIKNQLQVSHAFLELAKLPMTLRDDAIMKGDALAIIVNYLDVEKYATPEFVENIIGGLYFLSKIFSCYRVSEISLLPTIELQLSKVHNIISNNYRDRGLQSSLMTFHYALGTCIYTRSNPARIYNEFLFQNLEPTAGFSFSFSKSRTYCKVFPFFFKI
eukprot:TRINITY_DN7803_c0_g1_i1.p1 TRINITY_DN7803_c0_g1~~TRINITY_DN7803_c0_g1_i1.p1  ORF type:complete len:332 (-),score=37.14 TRINITY_DN7803_c0_g1_i1:355-1350(-)